MRRRTLQGTTALITGASSGIGEALALELDKRGVTLALAARREEKLHQLNDRLGGRHCVLVADVSETRQCEQLVDKAFDLLGGRIDTLIANAGYGATKLTWQHTPQEVRAMFATNVFGTHDVIHYTVPRMLKQERQAGDLRGQIVIVSSAAARRGLPFFGPYAGTKAAQLSLAEALRVELKEEGIAVTSVHPATTATEFGDVAERTGGVRVEKFGGRGRTSQTARQVALAMVKAMEKPKREVWPAFGYRWLLGLNSVLPGVGDVAMSHLKRGVDRA